VAVDKTDEGNLYIRTPLPTAKGTDKWGILQADLVGGTTTPVLANLIRVKRNKATSGSHGTVQPVLDRNGDPVQFKVIEMGILATSKKVASGGKIHCVKVARDLWAPDASACPVAV
jgi:hypothetical protein